MAAEFDLFKVKTMAEGVVGVGCWQQFGRRVGLSTRMFKSREELFAGTRGSGRTEPDCYLATNG